MANRKSAVGANSQVKSKQRVRDFAEVFTNEREVKAMCDLIPEDMYSDITRTFLEPACGEGVFLIEIFKRKLAYCKDARDGLKALNCLFGVDIQADNVEATRKNLLAVYKERFPGANDFAMSFARAIVESHIICDDCLNPQTEIVKSWGVAADAGYIRCLEKKKKFSEKIFE